MKASPTPLAALALTPLLALLAPPLAAVDFDFTPEPGMDQDAVDGFEAAGDLWSALLTDEVTVNVEIDFRPLSPGVLGATGSERITVTYQQIVDALVADASSGDDTAATGSLQPGPAMQMLLNRTSDSPEGSGSATPFLDDDSDDNNTTVRITRANAKALGLLDADDPALDASITFSSDFNWDFDPGDGILANHFDFIAVAAHEIGHALGFTSGVDILDGNSPPTNGPFPDALFTWVNSKDLFRFSTASTAQGAGTFDWTADTRAKFFSIDGGATDLGGFSTGRTFGDGQQASHWRDDRGLGLMDPTVATGESPPITDLDVQLFDVIGWNREEGAPPSALADLAVAVATSVDVTYVVTASNNGPDDVTGVAVDNVFPPEVSGVTWQCTASAGAACTASGSGDIHDTVTLPAGATVTYTATGTATGVGVNAATVTPPSGVQDDTPGNNSSG